MVKTGQGLQYGLKYGYIICNNNLWKWTTTREARQYGLAAFSTVLYPMSQGIRPCLVTAFKERFQPTSGSYCVNNYVIGWKLVGWASSPAPSLLITLDPPTNLQPADIQVTKTGKLCSPASWATLASALMDGLSLVWRMMDCIEHQLRTFQACEATAVII